MSKFSERLKELRNERQLSILNLAKEIGVSDATMCRWENGQNDVKGKDLIKLANYFNVSSDYLLGIEN